jgi:hypothetical protein
MASQSLLYPERKRAIGRLRCLWEDNIKIDLQEVVYGGME